MFPGDADQGKAVFALLCGIEGNLAGASAVLETMDEGVEDQIGDDLCQGTGCNAQVDRFRHSIENLDFRVL